MGITALKTALKKLDKDQLVSLVTDLYKKNNTVKEFFDFYVNPDEQALYNKYRDKLLEAFYPKRGNKFDLKQAKQATNDFKKLGHSKKLLAELSLFYVETGVRFTNDFGDINEAFYRSLATTFVDGLTLMRSEDLLDKFEQRIKTVIDDTQNIGWGLHDYLLQASMDFYPKEFDRDQDV